MTSWWSAGSGQKNSRSGPEGEVTVLYCDISAHDVIGLSNPNPVSHSVCRKFILRVTRLGLTDENTFILSHTFYPNNRFFFLSLSSSVSVRTHWAGGKSVETHRNIFEARYFLTDLFVWVLIWQNLKNDTHVFWKTNQICLWTSGVWQEAILAIR